MDTGDAAVSQRLDRWLWFARVFKTRSLATAAIQSKGVRITRDGQTQRTDKPSFGVRAGDVVALARNRRLFVLEVVDLGSRRGPAVEARTLYIDRSDPEPADGDPD